MGLTFSSVELLLAQVLTGASGTDNVLGLNGIIPACLKPEEMFSGVVVLSQAFENNIEKLNFVIAFPGDD